MNERGGERRTKDQIVRVAATFIPLIPSQEAARETTGLGVQHATIPYDKLSSTIGCNGIFRHE